MAVVSTLAIGPITTTPYSFTASKGGPVNTHGLGSVKFAGVMETVLADQLYELSVNPTGRQTIGGVSGQPAYIAASSPALPSYTGYYLIQSFDASPDGIDPNWPYSTFTLSAVYIGDLP